MSKKMRNVVVITILVGLAIVYFYYLTINSKSTSEKHNAEEVDEVEKLINKDFDESYPKTPREVVKMYSRIISTFYNENYNEDEKKLLAVQAQKLMDSELLEHNEYEEYYKNLCEDIEEYKQNKRKISSYQLDSSSDVEFKTLKERKYAFVKCTYYTKGKEGTAKVPEQYVLRQDEDGRWKILFWKLVNEDEEDE